MMRPEYDEDSKIEKKLTTFFLLNGDNNKNNKDFSDQASI